MSDINFRIKELVVHFSNGNNSDFAKKLGVNEANVRNYIAGTEPKFNFLEKIVNVFEISYEWLLTGRGEMFKREQNGDIEKSRNLIPFYDDVATIGGTDLVADTYNAVSVATDYIDAGDWFPSATAAIRHYGTSMIEYPNGCILALKRIYDTNSIVWGRNYVIETDEIRVTKRMQTCKTDDEC
ncbi:helix-turn-helix transcriptional regulator, partial [Riemerella anatipestifer]|nr:helix-turn-helix transcriptional regulator [Riemerella anatipestifer]